MTDTDVDPFLPLHHSYVWGEVEEGGRSRYSPGSYAMKFLFEVRHAPAVHIYSGLNTKQRCTVDPLHNRVTLYSSSLYGHLSGPFIHRPKLCSPVGSLRCTETRTLISHISRGNASVQLLVAM